MRFRALKILRGDIQAEPGAEFDCDNAKAAAALLEAGAIEPVAARVETAAEQVEAETADEAPPAPKPKAKPKPKPRKRATKKVNPKK